MTTPDFFSDPTPQSPEETIRQRHTLENIDAALIQQAKQKLVPIPTPETPETAELRGEYILAITGFASSSAAELIENIDPHFEAATLIKITDTPDIPGRFLFLKRLVTRQPERDMAAWFFEGKQQDILNTVLGRDGLLYGAHKTLHYQVKQIDLETRNFEQLTSIHNGLKDLMRQQRYLQSERGNL